MELLLSFFKNAFPTNVCPHLNQGAVVKVIGPGPILESKGKGQRTNKIFENLGKNAQNLNIF